MPSITYWNRIEPSPRTEDINRALSAQIRDPLWMLARQWQFGEFLGEDAGSIAYVKIQSQFGSFSQWCVDHQIKEPLTLTAPLEKTVLCEPFNAEDISLKVELGQLFIDMMNENGLPVDYQSDLYRNFKIQPDSYKDENTTNFLVVCEGRSIDGVAIYEKAKSQQFEAIPNYEDPGLRSVVERFVAWIDEVYGKFADHDDPSDAPSCNEQQLENRFKVIADAPSGNKTVFSVTSDSDGLIDWFSFDFESNETEINGRRVNSEASSYAASVIPGKVVFTGMPNGRWWNFETATFDLGAIHVDRRDIVKLVLIDFALSNSNDWYALPFDVQIGSICQLESLTVHDVFGTKFNIPSAADTIVPDQPRWRMFCLDSTENAPHECNFLIVPPSALTATQRGEPIEEVRFMRDEMANMVWAVEKMAENGIGEALPGSVRAYAGKVEEKRDDLADSQEQPDADGPLLKYVSKTDTPGHWIPFVPIRDSGDYQIALKGLRDEGSNFDRQLFPYGRILRKIHSQVLLVREEAVPRTGVQVSRMFHRTRWIDGSTHFWVSRVVNTGTGEGSSGLQFDVVKSVRD